MSKCQRCGSTIPKGRMDAIPETRLCVKCSEEVGGDFEVTVHEENHYKTFQSNLVITKKPRRIEKIGDLAR